ncbi:MAG: hypothetical protein DMF83_03155 [Acidobacteria bacterium]|nr:MAG: hypothetical protein DMF83_03155 [Acidobacteriota bacterium]
MVAGQPVGGLRQLSPREAVGRSPNHGAAPLALEHRGPGDVPGDDHGVLRIAGAVGAAGRGAVVGARLGLQPGRARRDAVLLVLRAARDPVRAGVRPAPPGPFAADAAGTFLAASSSFDSGAEWLLALGGVLALSERIQGELRQSNAGLLTAQEDLRRVADRDPLTGLANRRQLPETFRAVQPQGALLLFFDLDDFKQINDRYGHQAGDECLRRFAANLRECFRPSDVLVRYGGDEFLVVASGLDEAGGRERVGRLRERLRFVTGAGPAITFSVGRVQHRHQAGEELGGGQGSTSVRPGHAARVSASPTTKRRSARRTSSSV